MDTLCWGCKKALGGCSWSSEEAQPVEGWDAEKTIVKETGVNPYESYHVKSCPEYEPDDKRIISKLEISRILGVHVSTITRYWGIKKTIEEAAKKGYTLTYSYQDRIWYELRR